ncbi:Calponin homology (CH) domain [Popillia japonica]|uniref:Calponin homology (CH) domain n=1 Tax=Popillia japonica TaxID=7064 RepID=A0AAW1IWV3_POPJA
MHYQHEYLRVKQCNNEYNMSSTQAYYKDRLGFDPKEVLHDGPPPEKHRKTTTTKLQGYEENLSKFKDERDAIQKKTFTKWVNKHLKKVRREVHDLFQDLRDGRNLISLLEVLSGEQLVSIYFFK